MRRGAGTRRSSTTRPGRRLSSTGWSCPTRPRTGAAGERRTCWSGRCRTRVSGVGCWPSRRISRTWSRPSTMCCAGWAGSPTSGACNAPRSVPWPMLSRCTRCRWCRSRPSSWSTGRSRRRAWSTSAAISTQYRLGCPALRWLFGCGWARTSCTSLPPPAWSWPHTGLPHPAPAVSCAMTGTSSRWRRRSWLRSPTPARAETQDPPPTLTSGPCRSRPAAWPTDRRPGRPGGHRHGHLRPGRGPAGYHHTPVQLTVHRGRCRSHDQ